MTDKTKSGKTDELGKGRGRRGERHTDGSLVVVEKALQPAHRISIQMVRRLHGTETETHQLDVVLDNLTKRHLTETRKTEV
jgi:hypothetical protein